MIIPLYVFEYVFSEWEGNTMLLYPGIILSKTFVYCHLGYF